MKFHIDKYISIIVDWHFDQTTKLNQAITVNKAVFNELSQETIVLMNEFQHDLFFLRETRNYCYCFNFHCDG